MKWIISGAVFFVLGGVVGVWAIATFMDIIRSGTHPVVTVGSGQQSAFQVPEEGEYLLWNDYRTLDDGELVDSSENVPRDLAYTLKSSSGTDVEPTGFTSMTHKPGSQEEKGVVSYELEKGIYTLRIEPYPEPLVLSLNKNPGAAPFVFIAAIILTFILVAMAAVVVIVGLVKVVAKKAATRSEGVELS